MDHTNRLYYVLIVSLILHLSVFAKPKNAGNQAPQKPIFTNEETVLQLYQLMKDVHEVLSLKKIQYWAIAGTLLGAVRHQGLIPWDNDLDICIDKKQNSEFVSLKPIFEQLGYFVQSETNRIKHKIFLREPNKSPTVVPHLDIVAFEEKGEDVYYQWKAGPKGLKTEIIAKKDLFPMKTYNFGEFFVNGPHSPLTYLARCYRDDCIDVAYFGEKNGRGKNAQKIHLKKKDKIPAMPTGPLQDRVAQILAPEEFSTEIINFSNANSEQSQQLEYLRPIFIESFEQGSEAQLKEEHPEEYDALKKAGLTIRDVLTSRFNKIIATVLLQTNSKNPSSALVLKNDKGIIIGYTLFTQAPINQIMQSMIARKYITTIISLPEELLAPKGSAHENDTAYIYTIAVTPSYQKRGLGKKLIFSILSQYHAIKNIYLLTASSKKNASINAFYEHLGFELKGVLLTADNNKKNLYHFNTVP